MLCRLLVSSASDAFLRMMSLRLMDCVFPWRRIASWKRLSFRTTSMTAPSSLNRLSSAGSLMMASTARSTRGRRQSAWNASSVWSSSTTACTSSAPRRRWTCFRQRTASSLSPASDLSRPSPQVDHACTFLSCFSLGSRAKGSGWLAAAGTPPEGAARAPLRRAAFDRSRRSASRSAAAALELSAGTRSTGSDPSRSRTDASAP
mmetsp:Transcript_24956/g.59377  ORF Transcript_24956/g.59377 Transcript_24956/m.59377 type:complete len:204 (+) Transcript_24956:643-1254(+)